MTVYFPQKSIIVNADKNDILLADAIALSKGAITTEELAKAELEFNQYDGKAETHQWICLVAAIVIIATGILLGVLVTPLAGLTALAALIPMKVFKDSQDKLGKLKRNYHNQKPILLQKLKAIGKYYTKIYKNLQKKMKEEAAMEGKHFNAKIGHQIAEEVLEIYKDTIEIAQSIVKVHYQYLNKHYSECNTAFEMEIKHIVMEAKKCVDLKFNEKLYISRLQIEFTDRDFGD